MPTITAKATATVTLFFLVVLVLTSSAQAIGPTSCVGISQNDDSKIRLGVSDRSPSVVYQNITWFLSSVELTNYTIEVDGELVSGGSINGSIELPMSFEGSDNLTIVSVRIGSQTYLFRLIVMSSSYEDSIVDDYLSSRAKYHLSDGDYWNLIFGAMGKAGVIVLVVAILLIPIARRKKSEGVEQLV